MPGFILGSAVKHPYDLVTGHYSVHTNADHCALARATSRYRPRLHNRVSWHAQDAEDWSDGVEDLNEWSKNQCLDQMEFSLSNAWPGPGVEVRSTLAAPVEHFPVQAKGRGSSHRKASRSLSPAIPR